MIGSYLKIAMGQLLRHKTQSLINILGMSVGLACCLLIAVYVLFELSYDAHYVNAERIYRISGEFESVSRAEVSALAGPMLKEEFPDEVEEFARIYGNTPGLITRGDFSAFEDGFRMADNGLFRIFDFEWLRGDPATALSQPNTVVLTESMAAKYFPGENPLGKVLGLGAQQFPMTVVGIIRDLPENTHLSFSMLASIDLGVTRSGRPVENVLQNWNFNIFHTYVLLREGASIGTLEARFPELVDRYVPRAAPAPIGFTALNVRDIHLFSTMANEYKPTGNVTSLWVLGAIAAGVLLIACVNFMNLSTARSAQRAREIGMRKAMGAERHRIIAQFLGESLLMTALALGVAITVVELSFPVFTGFIGKEIDLAYLDGQGLFLALLAFAAFTGVAAGSYPAFFLSAFQAARVLKGDLSRGRAGVLFRNVLVLVQFSVSIILIVATVVVYQQMQFARTTNLGFRSEEIVVVEGTLAVGLGPQWRQMEDRLAQHPGVLSVSASGTVPLRPINWSASLVAAAT